MNEHSNGDFETRIRGALDAEADGVARRHGDRLAEARRAALAERTGPAARRWTVMLPVAASVAVVALTATLMWPSARPEPMPMTDDLDLLASDTFDLARDDLAFYAWLAEQELDEAPERSG